MAPAAGSGDPPQRTPPTTRPWRNVFVIAPDKKVKLVLVYPPMPRAQLDEVLRVIDSLQLTAGTAWRRRVNWKNGETSSSPRSVSDDDAKSQYPDGWKAPKPYIRHRPAGRAIAVR